MAVPSLRFKEFYSEWQLWKIGALCNHVSYGLTVRPEYVKAGIPLISAREIVLGKVAIDKAPLISHDDFESLSLKAKPQKDDVFLTKTGTIGLSAIFKSSRVIAITQNIAVIRFNQPKDFKPEFFIQYLKTRYFFKKAMSKVNQSTIMDLQLGDIKKLEIWFPNSQEQRKIADFLSAVDEKIGLLTAKKSTLETYKKGVMQKLFPKAGQTNPELRFKRPDGSSFPDWEEKRLGEVLKIGSGKDYKHLNEGGIPVYGTGGLMKYVDDYLHDGESVCIGRKGTIDSPQLLKGKFWTVDTLFYTHSYNDLDIYFLYTQFIRINWQKYNEASGVPSLSKKTIESINVAFPSLDEQKRIADYLHSLDNKKEFLETQIDQMKDFKKGLLQQMFV
jgi:type I restriction enzyme S subunit